MARKRSNHRSQLAAVIGFALFATIAMSACSRNNLAAKRTSRHNTGAEQGDREEH